MDIKWTNAEVDTLAEEDSLDRLHIIQTVELLTISVFVDVVFLDMLKLILGCCRFPSPFLYLQEVSLDARFSWSSATS